MSWFRSGNYSMRPYHFGLRHTEIPIPAVFAENYEFVGEKHCLQHHHLEEPQLWRNILMLPHALRLPAC